MLKKVKFKITLAFIFSFFVLGVTLSQLNLVYLHKVFASDPPTSPVTPPVTIVDLIPPTVSIINPFENAVVSGISPIDVSAIDNIAVASVQIFIDDILLSIDSTQPYSTNWDTSIYPHNSIHSILAVGYDTSNNFSTDSATVQVEDVTAPQVSITNPVNGNFVPRNTNITIQALAGDISGIINVKFYINGNLKCTDTTASYSCSWKVPSKRNVTYTLSATALDIAGNLNTNTVTVTSQ